MLNLTMKPVPVTCSLKSAKLHQHENRLGIFVRPSHRVCLTSGRLCAVICGLMNVTESATLNVIFILQF